MLFRGKLLTEEGSDLFGNYGELYAHNVSKPLTVGTNTSSVIFNVDLSRLDITRTLESNPRSTRVYFKIGNDKHFEKVVPFQ